MTNLHRYSKQKKSTVLLLLGIILSNTSKKFFMTLPRQSHGVVTITHNATLQCKVS